METFPFLHQVNENSIVLVDDFGSNTVDDASAVSSSSIFSPSSPSVSSVRFNIRKRTILRRDHQQSSEDNSPRDAKDGSSFFSSSYHSGFLAGLFEDVDKAKVLSEVKDSKDPSHSHADAYYAVVAAGHVVRDDYHGESVAIVASPSLSCSQLVVPRTTATAFVSNDNKNRDFATESSYRPFKRSRPSHLLKDEGAPQSSSLSCSSCDKQNKHKIMLCENGTLFPHPSSKQQGSLSVRFGQLSCHNEPVFSGTTTRSRSTTSQNHQQQDHHHRHERQGQEKKFYKVPTVGTFPLFPCIVSDDSSCETTSLSSLLQYHKHRCSENHSQDQGRQTTGEARSRRFDAADDEDNEDKDHDNRSGVAFGWFVDMEDDGEEGCGRYRDHEAALWNQCPPLSFQGYGLLEGTAKTSTNASIASSDLLAFQAPTAPMGHTIQRDAEIEWAQAADMVDSVLGDIF
jgi:hypothetical protein